MAAEEWMRTVQHRCPNIGRHRPGPGCPCHPTIPEPCPECSAVEVLSRVVPYADYAAFKGAT